MLYQLVPNGAAKARTTIIQAKPNVVPFQGSVVIIDICDGAATPSGTPGTQRLVRQAPDGRPRVNLDGVKGIANVDDQAMWMKFLKMSEKGANTNLWSEMNPEMLKDG